VFRSTITGHVFAIQRGNVLRLEALGREFGWRGPNQMISGCRARHPDLPQLQKHLAKKDGDNGEPE